MRLTGNSSRLIFPFPVHHSHYRSFLIPMNSVYASHSHGTLENSRIMHTSSRKQSSISSVGQWTGLHNVADGLTSDHYRADDVVFGCHQSFNEGSHSCLQKNYRTFQDPQHVFPGLCHSLYTDKQ